MKAVFLDTGTLGPDDIDLHPLTAQLPDLELFTETSPALVAERISDANIVFVNKVRLTAELLADAPALKLVCLAATGTDNVDLDAARDAGIVVCNIREYCTTSVVQHVFALLLNTAETWLRDRGMTTVKGPFSFSINTRRTPRKHPEQ